MMTIDEIIMLVLIIGASFAAGFILNGQLNSAEIVVINEVNTTECDLNKLQGQLQGYEKELVLISERTKDTQSMALYYEKQNEYDFLETLQEKFAASHTYTAGKYDCKHYSRDMKIVMNHLGYDVEVIGTETSKGKGHVWNELTIEIEPQQGEMIGYYFTDKVRYSKGKISDIERYIE